MYWKGRLFAISRNVFYKYTHSGQNIRRPPQCPPCHKEDSANFWRTISFALIPIIGILSFNQYMSIKKHSKFRPPFVPYEHLRIRNKRFPWGEGQKSLFHNRDINALPDGYEPEGDPPEKKSKKEAAEEEE